MSKKNHTAPGSEKNIKILVVDDNQGHVETMEEALEKVGYTVVTATSSEEAADEIEGDNFDLLITDLVMDDQNGLDLLKKAKKKSDYTEVILVTGYGSVESAVEAMQEGAFDYLEKPININVLRAKVAKAMEKIQLRRTNLELRRQLDEKFKFEGIVGNSPKMREVLQRIVNVSPTNATVLITGENGTGKELVAKTIHNNSPRQDNPFVALNCAAVPESLLESELFGTVPGAFTNATARKGKIEFAHRGTLLLDEIGDMPLPLQAKLLRVIEQKEITRLGANESKAIDVRILASTNRDLEKAVEEEEFRKDLYYRLRVFEVHVPPLRERQEDIPVLIDHFIKELSQEYNKDIQGVSPEVRKLFFRYEWPGNVRELKNCIQSMIINSQAEILTLGEVPEWILDASRETKMNITAGYSWDEYEKEIIRNTLKLTDGNRAEAAKILGIGERTLYRKLKKYELVPSKQKKS